ncbi:MAG: hypothetical protein ACJ8G5_14395, partial [Burkholderiales bacterium]
PAADIARLESLCHARCASVEASSTIGTGHFSPIRRFHTWLYHRFYVYGLLRETLARLAMQLGVKVGWGRAAYPALWQDHQGLEFRLVKFALAGIRDAVGGAGAAPMMVVIYPDVQNIGRENAYYGIYQDVEKDLARALGVPVRSGYAAFLDNPEAKRDMPYSLTDNHPSCKAHQLFARWVFTEFEQATGKGLVRVTGR